MNATRATIAVLAVVSVTPGLGCATPAAVQPTRAWDQAAVTTLSDELVDRVEKAYAIANREPVRPDAVESVNTYLNNIRLMETQAKELQARLRDGKGYQQTLWNYTEIRRFFRILENSPSWAAIEGELRGSGASQASIADVLVELDDYYGKR